MVANSKQGLIGLPERSVSCAGNSLLEILGGEQALGPGVDQPFD